MKTHLWKIQIFSSDFNQNILKVIIFNLIQIKLYYVLLQQILLNANFLPKEYIFSYYTFIAIIPICKFIEIKDKNKIV